MFIIFENIINGPFGSYKLIYDCFFLEWLCVCYNFDLLYCFVQGYFSYKCVINKINFRYINFVFYLYFIILQKFFNLFENCLNRVNECFAFKGKDKGYVCDMNYVLQFLSVLIFLPLYCLYHTSNEFHLIILWTGSVDPMNEA